MRSAKCEVRNVDAGCQMPEASQGADILPIEQIYKGGVPSFEGRGTALIFTYSFILSFKRAYK